LFFDLKLVRGQTLSLLLKKNSINVFIFKINDKEMENVNKRGQKVGKHVELWVKNYFIEWKVF
jgi:hypothetical protein